MVINTENAIQKAEGDVELALAFQLAKTSGLMYQVKILSEEVRRLGGDPEKAIKDAPRLV